MLIFLVLRSEMRRRHASPPVCRHAALPGPAAGARSTASSPGPVGSPQDAVALHANLNSDATL